MMLTHLVVRAGLGAKGPSMSKKELDDVLRWGTEELFKEDEAPAPDPAAEGGDGTATTTAKPEQQIIWDDRAVDALLDRSQTGETMADDSEKENWANEYLSSFKLAQYEIGEAEEEEEEEPVCLKFKLTIITIRMG